MPVSNLEALKRAVVQNEPYRHFFGSGLLRAEAIDALDRDFPKLKHAGYLTLREIKPAGAFATFLDELQGPEMAAAVSEALDLDVSGHPPLVTIMRWCAKRAGRIHTDGKAKLATMLVYFNRSWDAGNAGAVRILRGPDKFEDMAAEVPPLMGNFLGFRRCDHSWHGHLPFKGERRVVQVTWLASEADLIRKRRTNAFTQMLKSISQAGAKRQ